MFVLQTPVILTGLFYREAMTVSVIYLCGPITKRGRLLRQANQPLRTLREKYPLPNANSSKLAGFEFLAKELDMLAHRGIVLEVTLHGVDGMQGRGVVAVEAFSDGLQWLVRVSA